MTNKLRIFIWIVIVATWMGIIFNFSNMDTIKSNNKSMETINIIIKKTLDVTNKIHITHIDSKKTASLMAVKLNHPLRKVAHASIYFVLSIFLIITLKFCKVRYFYIISLIICFLYACTDEFHQLFIMGRTSNIKDVLIDTVGSTLGLVMCYIMIYLIEKINRRKVRYEES